MFNVSHRDTKSRARTGKFTFPSGAEVMTPAYVIVGTYGRVQLLSPEDLNTTKTQIVIVNTYHMWRILETEGKLENFPGLKDHMGWDGALMTDSGGFQVLSLGAGMRHGAGKIAFPGREKKKSGEEIVSLDPDGARFEDIKNNFSGFLTPEKSIGIQECLGADVTFVLDECTSPLHDKKYTKESLSLTNAWALRSLHAKKRKDQMLYGIVQGGTFRDLRESSARFLVKQDFDGFGIGGSLGEEWNQMFPVLDWVIPILPEGKPRHLLGIGEIHDIFEGVERGIDTFDCIIPTREGRNDAVWTRKGRVNGTGKWQESSEPIDEWCDCKFCKGPEAMTRSELKEAGKEKRKYVFSYHNVRFFNKIMEEIRKSIAEDRFLEFKKEFLDGVPKRK